MSIKYKRRAPAKLIVMGVLFVIMSLAATVGIVAVLALTSRTITSNVNITYTAVDIDGEVEAAYKIGDEGSWISMNGDAPYRFSAEDQTANKQMNPADIELTSQNRYVEFRYIFRNYGHADYTAILTLNEVDETNNIKLDYKYNNNSYTPTGYGLVIEGTDSPLEGKVQISDSGEEYVEMTYYVKATVKQLTRNANYQSEFFWLLENYEAQPGEETIRLATSKYTDNGDGTYSASYSGANISVANIMSGSSSVENIWAVPSRFGSASVTKVTPGSDLPANTKVVLSDSITEIGETFTTSIGLVDIRLGNNITKIPAYAFMGSSLSKMEIPESVTSIGERAFSCCANLINVTIPEGVTTIEKYTFGECDSLTNVTMPDSVTRIETQAFEGCNSLTSINLGNELKSIGGSAFWYCSSLYLEIPKSVTNIGSSAFSGCKTVKYTVKVGETFDKTIFSGCESVEIELEDGITEIYDDMFSLLNLTKIIIPNSVTRIGNSAFEKCCLTSVVIPDSVTSIGELAFMDCVNLTSIEIPAGVTDIGYGAFWLCSSLINVEIPEGVTTIGDYAFSDCSGLTSVVIPNSVTSIGSVAFGNCYSLTSVQLGDGLKRIEDGAFEGCDSLTSIVIPSSVTDIGMSVFYGCYSLVEIYDLRSTQMTAEEYGTSGDVRILSAGDNSVIYTDCQGVQYYEYETGKYKVFNYTGTNTEITIPSTYNGGEVTEIRWYAFAVVGNKNITKVTIDEGITTIGECAFEFCENAYIEIPKSVTNIGSEAFNMCKTVKYTVKVGETFDKTIFSGCESVEMELEDGITEIYDDMLSQWYQLTKITIPNSVISIGSGAFFDCMNLENIEIGCSVTSIGSYAFYNCYKLTNIEIPNTVTSIGEDAFYGCSGLTSVVIPDSVTSIGDSAFSECRNLTSLEIGSGVTTIGKGVFDYCTSLTNIIVDENNTMYASEGNCLLNKAKTELIKGCNTASIIIPESVTSIEVGAFAGCSGLTSVEFKETEGWCYETLGIIFSLTGLENTGTAANYLKSTNTDCRWFRTGN